MWLSLTFPLKYTRKWCKVKDLAKIDQFMSSLYSARHVVLKIRGGRKIPLTSESEYDLCLKRMHSSEFNERTWNHLFLCSRGMYKVRANFIPPSVPHSDIFFCVPFLFEKSHFYAVDVTCRLLKCGKLDCFARDLNFPERTRLIFSSW